LTGNTDIEDGLERLDKLTQEEARMASAELLKMTHSIDGKVTGVDDRVKGVEEKVQDVRGDVHDVGNKVQGVEGKVQDIRGDVQEVDHRVQSIGGNVKTISSKVQGVDHKLEQVNRSLSLSSLIPSTHTSSQRHSSEIIFYDGFHPQIHPPIITSHAMLITTAQLNGFFKGVYSINGNLLAPSCGYTENVRYSWPLPSVNS
jgi:archaellum component FlaC